MTCTVHVLSMYYYVRNVQAEAEQACTDFKIHIILYNSTLKIHEKYTKIHDGTLWYTPSQEGTIAPARENVYFACFVRVPLCTLNVFHVQCKI